MRFNRKTAYLFITTLAAIALFAAPILAQAGPGRPGRHLHPGPHGPGADMAMRGMVERLDLTAEQQEQFEQIRARHHDDNQALRDRLETAHEQFAALAHAETFDEAAVRAAAAEVAQARAEMMVSHAAMMQELRQILTAEQLERFQAMRGKSAERMGGRGHGRGDFGPGPHGSADCPRFEQAPDPDEE